RELCASVPDVDVPEPGQAVDVFAALDVRDGRAAAPDIHHRLEMIARMMERMDQMLLVVLDEHCGLDRPAGPPRVGGRGGSPAGARGPDNHRRGSGRRAAGPDTSR